MEHEKELKACQYDQKSLIDSHQKQVNTLEAGNRQLESERQKMENDFQKTLEKLKLIEKQINAFKCNF